MCIAPMKLARDLLLDAHFPIIVACESDAKGSTCALRETVGQPIAPYGHV